MQREVPRQDDGREEKMEEETRMTRMEEKKAEKRGKKREADCDAMDGESQTGGAGEGGGPEEASGDGMTIEAVLRNDDAWDDMKGSWLHRENVREARMEEVGRVKRKLLWDEVSRSDASMQKIISVKCAKISFTGLGELVAYSCVVPQLLHFLQLSLMVCPFGLHVCT